MKKFIILIIIILLICGGIYIITYMNQTEPSICLKDYFNKLNNKDYEGMYNDVITDISKEEFVLRIKNIYEGIEAENINITVFANIEDENNKDIINVTYKASMETVAGNMNYINTTKLIKEEEKYKLIWDSSVIFPDLKDEYKVRVENLISVRGSIYDRNDIAIAKDGTAYSVGVVPGKIENKEDITELANLLGIRQADINEALSVEYVNDDTFVPLRKISKDEQELKNKLLNIKGVLITDINSRIYPYKETTSMLTGYIQDGVGKTGLEYAYNDRLEGSDGKEIYIVDENNNKVKTLLKIDAKNGEDIKTTIDIKLQQKLYNNFKDDPGAHVSMNYNTGEILALVSISSYDANKIVLGLTTTEWNNLQNDKNNVMYNRYLSLYVPGSSLKPVVGAIGLKGNYFTKDDDFGESGTKWQNDESWENLYVTTLTTYQGPANLRNAIIYSDNIYFAKAALKIGRNNLQEGLNDFGFNDKIEFVQDMSISSYGKMDSDSAIANSGYGQDQMLVNPIHMAMIYSSFANGGNMVMPCLEYIDTKYYKMQVISEEIASVIKQDLVQVIEEGTGKDAKIEGKILAGKTGTAEIKENQQDESGTEIGWFNCFDENGILIISMVENVKEKGGSHYLLPKIKNVFEYIDNE